MRHLDDLVFKNLSLSKYSDKIDTLSLIQILFYLHKRLKSQKSNNENDYLLKELIIHTINMLYQKLDVHFFEEPYSYHIDYQIPQFLYTLSLIYKQDFYNNRILNILNEVSHNILSIVPILNSNKLYLLWGINAISELTGKQEWVNHSLLLKRELNIKTLFNIELLNKNVFFEDGVTSIFCLIQSMKKNFKKDEYFYCVKEIANKLKLSESWTLMHNDMKYFDSHLGLFNGYCGVSMLSRHLNINAI